MDTSGREQLDDLSGESDTGADVLDALGDGEGIEAGGARQQGIEEDAADAAPDAEAAPIPAVPTLDALMPSASMPSAPVDPLAAELAAVEAALAELGDPDAAVKAANDIWLQAKAERDAVLETANKRVQAALDQRMRVEELAQFTWKPAKLELEKKRAGLVRRLGK